MPMNGIPEPVDPPPRRPPLSSLLGTLRAAGLVVEHTTDPQRFGSGTSSDSSPCPSIDVEDPCDASAVVPLVCSDGAVLEAQPWAARVCMSRTNLDQFVDLDAKVRGLLSVCEHEALGTEFWSGTQSRASTWGNPYLTSDGSTEVGTALSVAQGLADMEQALIECACGAQSMIHAAANVVSLWSSLGMVTRQGGIIQTVLGTIVVTDPGYDGSGPQPGAAPASATSSWIYGTLLVDAHLGAVKVTDGYDEELNDHVTCANRLMVARFESCCHLRAEVDPSTVCG